MVSAICSIGGQNTLHSEKIFLSPPHMSGLEEQFITKAFETNWIAPLGPNVEAFESELADEVNVAGAVALSSGTAGIHLALRALEVGENDLIFCSTLTFVASANPILYCKAKPVFIDSEPDSWNMSAIALQNAFSETIKNGQLPKAVIVTNIYGQSADLDILLRICQRYDVPLIEDAAESLGATYKGRPSGTIGLIGVYSFNGNKIITTSGGGALVSNNLNLLKKVRFLATQAREPARHYQHHELGYNYRLSNILAGVGRGQLSVLRNRIEARRSIFRRYFDAINIFPGVSFMPEPAWSFSTRWLTTLLVNPEITGVSRDDIILSLEENNIESRPVWKPLHSQPLYHEAAYYAHDYYSVSDKLFNQGICLPSGSSLSTEQQNMVIDCIQHLLQSS
jgi:pyridoxal phosphate-dependent aminotransferase EpsN